MTREVRKRSAGTDWLGLAAFGFFLLLIGTIWIVNSPDVNVEAEAFVRPENWHLANVTENIAIPEPARSYPVIYTAAMQFCFIFGAFEAVILILRLALHESINRIADAVSGMAFWFSAGYFLSLVASQSIGWFAFLAGIVISGGLAIVAASLVKLLR
jgi:hypothetical protein